MLRARHNHGLEEARGTEIEGDYRRCLLVLSKPRYVRANLNFRDHVLAGEGLLHAAWLRSFRGKPVAVSAPLGF